ncbi:hypothetical protein B0E48_00005 [Rhodanobacter sp. C03]|nr:hypothetical protein B0E48_00005 [Rhodanobacter sp. C03]
MVIVARVAFRHLSSIVAEHPNFSLLGMAFCSLLWCLQVLPSGFAWCVVAGSNYSFKADGFAAA